MFIQTASKEELRQSFEVKAQILLSEKSEKDTMRIYNKVNSIKKRVPLNVVAVKTFTDLKKQLDLKTHSDIWRSKALVHAYCIELVTDSPHLLKFWEEHWEKSDRKTDPLCKIFSFTHVGHMNPKAIVCPQLMQGLIINTEHYNQVKSLTLALVGKYAESQKGFFVPGSAFSLNDQNVCFLGAGKTGKTTLTYLLLSSEKKYRPRLIANDAFYADEAGTIFRTEQGIYMRTDIVKLFPEWEDKIKNSPLQNANISNLGASLSSYCVISPNILLGEERLLEKGKVDQVFIIERNFENPQVLTTMTDEEALKYLKAGKYFKYDYSVLNAENKPLTIGSKAKPYFNSHLLNPESRVQEDLYRNFLEGVKIYKLNTVVSIQETIGILEKTILE